MLFQSGDEIWLYEIESKTGKRLATGIWVEDIISWIDDHHLLVRTREITDRDKSPLSLKKHMHNGPEKTWGMLSLS